jgi:GT2 family glycosyltransferase
LRLSIVIASWNGPASLKRCLQSIEQQASGNEIIAVTNFDAGAAHMMEREFSQMRHVPMPEGTTVPVLRAEGIRQSRGEIVALAEDHCTFAADWCSELAKAHELPYMAIGGAVENGSSQTTLGWAVYFYDYGRYMLPLSAGPAVALSGNNVSYKRAVLCEIEPTFREGLFEPFTHGELARRGYSLYLAPAIIVYHQKAYRLEEATAQAYHLARNFAAKRVSGASLARRTALAGGALILLPIVLLSRILFRTLGKRRLLPELIRCTHYLVLLTATWSLGEFAGYVAGAGSSADKWK